MSSLVPNKAVFVTTLAADVTNSSTFTISYPTGFVQGNFSTGQAQAAYMIVNDNNRYAAADSKMSVAFGASNITVTNSTGQTLVAGSTISVNIAVNDGPVETLQIPIAALSGISAADVVTAITPGLNGTIEYWEFVTSVPVTTGSKLATLSLKINSTAVTGGAIALTSAAATPLGKVIAGAAITGNNAIKAGDTLSVVASSVTAFVEGSGWLNIRVRQTNPNSY